MRLIIEYDGTGFHGWQLQPGMRTVQSELELALKSLTGEDIRPTASGRTDAGVHALGQAVSFVTESRLGTEVFLRGLNALLPGDLCVLSSEEAGPGFDARRMARGKVYRYLIRDGAPRSALEAGRTWWIKRRLEIEPMREAATALVGEHDFSSFRASNCEAKSPVREMRRIEIFRDAGDRLVIELWATAFLKNMARAMVGTLVEVGLGKTPLGAVRDILESRDRDKAGATAPAEGLYLVKVIYED